MENLYLSKGGTQEFNCVNMRLSASDINQLEDDLNNDRLTHTPGFFFGGDQFFQEDRESLKEFIQKSREAMANGMAIFYDSWW